SNALTICGITLKRSYTTPMASAHGHVSIEVTDEADKQVPARVGIYDHTGRLPLPTEESIPVRFGAVTRIVDFLPYWGGVRWPVQNHTGFFVDGRYHARLPVGEYELVVSKGPEYRVVHQFFSINDDRPTEIKVSLRRWLDMPAKGWYSGDDHIHYEHSS